MLLSTMSAHDLGYIGPLELSLRLRRAFDSIARLLHYRGHLLNWYDTTNLQPLLPRYVSTVDSGNFAGCLVALKQGLKEMANAPVVRVASWDGLLTHSTCSRRSWSPFMPPRPARSTTCPRCSR